MTDISSLGTQFTIKTEQGNVLFDSSDLSLDSNPLEVGQTQVAAMDTDLNGNVVYYTIKRPYEVVISFIPGSPGDIKMTNLLYASRNGEEGEYHIVQFIVSYPSGATVTYYNGRVISGPMTASVSKDGKLTGGTYKMSFAKANIVGAYSKDVKNKYALQPSVSKNTKNKVNNNGSGIGRIYWF